MTNSVVFTFGNSSFSALSLLSYLQQLVSHVPWRCHYSEALPFHIRFVVDN